MDLDSLAEGQYSPPVKKRDWMADKHMELVTQETLDRVIDECITAGLYALDLETTGLDNRIYQGETVAKIVGACLSPAPFDVGYYVPMRHKRGTQHNIPPRLAEAALRRLEESASVAVFHHGKFDHEFLQFPGSEPIGWWDDADKWEDTFIEAYVLNTRERNKGLKFLSRRDLGMEMIELKELFPPKTQEFDFSDLDPSDESTLLYACSDAICTGLLHLKYHPEVINPTGKLSPMMDYQIGAGHGKGQATIYKVEKLCLPATRWMERCRILIDKDKLVELIRLGQQEFFDSLKEVYDGADALLARKVSPNWFTLLSETFTSDPDSPIMAQIKEAEALAKARNPDPMGKIVKDVPNLKDKKLMEAVEFLPVYDILSAQQLGLMMRELGVEGLKVTEKSGQIKTSQDVLDEVIENAGKKFPFMAKVKRFREVQKALSSNLLPIYDALIEGRSWDDTIRCQFNGHKVDTGRFSTPTPRKGLWTGSVNWNIHSIPSTYDPNRPECMRRIREIIVARPGKTLFAIDYAGVELRVVTNLSGEPKWLEEFFHCADCDHKFPKRDEEGQPKRPPPFCPKCGGDHIGDLHTLTGINLYGADALSSADWKQRRQNAKGSNFALSYGGGGNAVCRSTGVPKQEGWRIKNQFDKTYTGLRAWWGRQHDFARKHGYVVTAFGRRYPQPDIHHENGFFRSKAERNSVNGPVQGGSADVMKFAMALIYRACKQRGWLDKVLMTVTIHDELVFEIDDDIAEEAIDVIVDILVNKAVKNLRWAVPLAVDIEMGNDWTVPYDLTKLMWNKAKPGKSWDAHWCRLFPKRYAHYLSIGGKPVDGVETPPGIPPAPTTPESDPAPSTPSSEPAASASSTPKPEPSVSASSTSSPPVSLGSPSPQPSAALTNGEVFVHQISRRQMKLGTIEKLATVIHKSRNRGTHPLRIQLVETGEVVWDEGIMVDPTAFTVMAREHGV